MRYYFVIFFLLVGLVSVAPVTSGNNDNSFQNPMKTSMIQQDEFDDIEWFPENFTDDFAEMFMDLLWDVDGDSGFDGIFVVIYSYIPGLGENGTVFIQVFFLFSIAGGALFLAKRVRGY